MSGASDLINTFNAVAQTSLAKQSAANESRRIVLAEQRSPIELEGIVAETALRKVQAANAEYELQSMKNWDDSIGAMPTLGSLKDEVSKAPDSIVRMTPRSVKTENARIRAQAESPGELTQAYLNALELKNRVWGGADKDAVRIRGMLTSGNTGLSERSRMFIDGQKKLMDPAPMTAEISQKQMNNPLWGILEGQPQMISVGALMDHVMSPTLDPATRAKALKQFTRPIQSQILNSMHKRGLMDMDEVLATGAELTKDGIMSIDVASNQLDAIEPGAGDNATDSIRKAITAFKLTDKIPPATKKRAASIMDANLAKPVQDETGASVPLRVMLEQIMDLKSKGDMDGIKLAVSRLDPNQRKAVLDGSLALSEEEIVNEKGEVTGHRDIGGNFIAAGRQAAYESDTRDWVTARLNRLRNLANESAKYSRGEAKTDGEKKFALAQADLIKAIDAAPDKATLRRLLAETEELHINTTKAEADQTAKWGSAPDVGKWSNSGFILDVKDHISDRIETFDKDKAAVKITPPPVQNPLGTGTPQPGSSTATPQVPGTAKASDAIIQKSVTEITALPESQQNVKKAALIEQIASLDLMDGETATTAMGRKANMAAVLSNITQGDESKYWAAQARGYRDTFNDDLAKIGDEKVRASYVEAAEKTTYAALVAAGVLASGGVGALAAGALGSGLVGGAAGLGITIGGATLTKTAAEKMMPDIPSTLDDYYKRVMLALEITAGGTAALTKTGTAIKIPQWIQKEVSRLSGSDVSRLMSLRNSTVKEQKDFLKVVSEKYGGKASDLVKKYFAGN